MEWIIFIAVLFGILIVVALVNEQNEKEKIALMTPDEKQKYLAEKQSRSEQHKPVNTRPVKQVRRKKNQLSTGEKVALLPVKFGVDLGLALMKGLLKAGKKR